MMQLDGKPVSAIAPQPQRQRDAGVPPAWQSYVTVQDADAAVARAKELGGGAHTDAFDVMEVGRMAVLQDPQGAYFMIWQPRARIGASLVNGPGCSAGTSSQARTSMARRPSTAVCSAGRLSRLRAALNRI